jgi:hypothetical protein
LPRSTISSFKQASIFGTAFWSPLSTYWHSSLITIYDCSLLDSYLASISVSLSAAFPDSLHELLLI